MFCILYFILRVENPVSFVASLSCAFIQTGIRELFSCMCSVHAVQERLYFHKATFIGLNSLATRNSKSVVLTNEKIINLHRR